MRNKHKLILCDLRDDVIQALKTSFGEVEGVVIKQKDITRIRCAAMATAGNSFGDMGGGVDKAIDNSSKGRFQYLVRKHIQSHYFGELPVGSAIFVQDGKRSPGLIYAPTMRIPGRIDGSINAYLAMRAILSVMASSELSPVACVALGTGVGGLPPDDAADQMYQAYRMIAHGDWRNVHYSLQAPYSMR